MRKWGVDMALKGQLKGEFVNYEWCGKLTYKTPSQLAKHEHHYCSNKCQSEKSIMIHMRIGRVKFVEN